LYADLSTAEFEAAGTELAVPEFSLTSRLGFVLVMDMLLSDIRSFGKPNCRFNNFTRSDKYFRLRMIGLKHLYNKIK
jgi:hypothetical protein